MALGWHLRLAANDRRVVAPDRVSRRSVVRAILAQTRALALLAFAIADTHLHLQLAACSRALAMSVVKRLSLALGRRLHVVGGFEPVYVGAIESQSHMVNTFEYVLNQHERHGLVRSGWIESTSLLDWAGARPGGVSVREHVERYLPRAEPELTKVLGARESWTPASGPAQGVVPAGLCAALLPDLAGSDRERNRLRRVLLTFLPRNRLWTVEAQARLLNTSVCSHLRLREQPVDEQLRDAVALLLGLAARTPDLAEQLEREAAAIKARRQGR